MTKEKFNIYTEVTAQIIAALESGEAKNSRFWTKLSQWHVNFQGKEYQGINQILLAMQGSGYARPQWITYKQAQELGGNVKKGEKSSLVVFASFFEDETKKDARGNPQKIWYMKGHRVFNVGQTENLPEQFYAMPSQKFADFDAIERFITAIGADVRHGGNSAYYCRATDHIQMPLKAQFTNANDYYSILLHELTHWTGAEARNNRPEHKTQMDAIYCKEELIAEIGAAFLCAKFGLDATPREDHAAYIGAYLKLLKTDNKAIFAAAKEAQKAVEFLTNLTNAQPMLMAAE